MSDRYLTVDFQCASAQYINVSVDGQRWTCIAQNITFGYCRCW
jgi:hypothetical protein